MRIIDADALKKAYFNAINETSIGEVSIITLIDNAPTVLFPLTVKIKDNVSDEDIELLKRLMTDYKPQVLNLERPQGEYEYTEEDMKQAIKENFDLGYEMAKNKYERPKGEREFIEILAQNVPDDSCTYPEYRGKPYYSIHYKENGEEFVGFGTYNPEVLSRYLKEYFMKGGAE